MYRLNKIVLDSVDAILFPKSTFFYLENKQYVMKQMIYSDLD